MANVLEGIRILDFGRYIAGPFCGMLLADMGAEVIRIEKIDGSEDRYTIPVGKGADGEYSVGAMFLQMNRNKLGLTLNPMKPEGREIVHKLVATADVVIANLPAPALKTMGLDYESLSAIKSDIILTAVSAFGSTGPYSDRVGFDGVAAAMSGMMHLTGNPDKPMKAYTPWVDYGTASGAAFGTLAALIHRDKTGEGQVVEGTLLGTALAFNNALLIEQAMIQPDRIGTGNRGQIAAPSDAFYCKDDEWIIVQVIGQPAYFDKLLQVPILNLMVPAFVMLGAVFSRWTVLEKAAGLRWVQVGGWCLAFLLIRPGLVDHIAHRELAPANGIVAIHLDPRTQHRKRSTQQQNENQH